MCGSQFGWLAGKAEAVSLCQYSQQTTTGFFALVPQDHDAVPEAGLTGDSASGQEWMQAHYRSGARLGSQGEEGLVRGVGSKYACRRTPHTRLDGCAAAPRVENPDSRADLKNSFSKF